MITSYGKQDVIYLIGGSIISGAGIPYQCGIGSGSGTAQSSDVRLYNEESRHAFTEVSYPSAQKIQFITDWNSVEMSGLNLSEFGIFKSGTALTGSLWSRSSLPNVGFEGTTELRIQETWEAG